MLPRKYLAAFFLVWSAALAPAHAQGALADASETDVIEPPPPAAAFGPSNEAEKQAYCRNVEDTAQAEKLLNSGITGSARLGQSDVNPKTKQAVIGVTKSLSRHLQGNSALRAAVLECRLYGRSLDVQRIVQYKMALIDKQVAERQVLELQRLLGVFDQELDAAQKRKVAGNATLADVMALTQQRLQLYNQYSAVRSSAMLPIPQVPDINPEDALREVDDLTRALQEELNYKQSLQAWDLQLIVGMQKPILGSADGSAARTAGPFASLNFTYNLNAMAYARKLAESVESLMELRQRQNEGLAVQVRALEKNIADSLTVQKDLLAEIRAQIERLKADFTRLSGLRSVEAMRMMMQIRLNLATARMQERLARFKIRLLSGPDGDAAGR